MTAPDDPGDLEGRLRQVLHGAAGHTDADALLTTVHRRVRRRRVRRAVGGTAVAVAVMAGSGYAVAATGIVGSHQTPVADHTANASEATPEPSAAETPPPATATRPAPASQPTPTHSSSSSSSSSSGAGMSASVPVPPSTLRLTPGLAAGAPVHPVSLTATGTAHQWVLAVSTDGCPAGSCATLLTTTDGGDSWTALGTFPAHAVPPTSRENVRFVLADGGYQGWVYGNALYSTHDGGTTWQRQTAPGEQVSLLAAWGKDVYAVFSGQSGQTLKRSPVTTDAWQPAGPDKALGPITALAHASGALALIDQPPGKNSARVWVSSDHGDSWHWARDACQGDGTPSSLSTAGDSLWVTCSTGSGTGLSMTTDGGKSWVWAQGNFPENVTVAARDNDHAIVVGNHKYGIRLASTVAPPRLLRTDAPQGVTFAGFTNSSTGYLLAADGTVWHTTDSGAGWTPYEVTTR